MRIIRIAKITSEDCIAWIIKNVAPGTNFSDWKRRSKKAIDGYIVRSFENIKSKMITQVYEQNGVIVAPALAPAPAFSSNASPIGMQNSESTRSKYVYGWATIRISDDDDDDDIDGYLVVCPRGDYSSDELDEDVVLALMKHNIMPTDETNFEIPRGKKSELKSLLNTDPELKSLLQYDGNFQKFLRSSGGAYEFEYDK